MPRNLSSVGDEKKALRIKRMCVKKKNKKNEE